MKKVINDKEDTQVQLKHGLLWVWLVFLIFGFGNILLAEDLSTGISIVSREKTRVEEAGLTLIKEGEKSSGGYRVGKAYYTEACAAFNGWIEGTIFALKSGKGPEEIDANINILSSAIEKSNKFYYYIYPPKVDNTNTHYSGYYPSPKTIINVGMIVAGIVDWLTKVWDDKNEELIKQLNGLKIKDFSVLEIELK